MLGLFHALTHRHTHHGIRHTPTVDFGMLPVVLDRRMDCFHPIRGRNMPLGTNRRCITPASEISAVVEVLSFAGSPSPITADRRRTGSRHVTTRASLAVHDAIHKTGVHAPATSSSVVARRCSACHAAPAKREAVICLVRPCLRSEPPREAWPRPAVAHEPEGDASKRPKPGRRLRPGRQDQRRSRVHAPQPKSACVCRMPRQAGAPPGDTARGFGGRPAKAGLTWNFIVPTRSDRLSDRRRAGPRGAARERVAWLKGASALPVATASVMDERRPLGLRLWLPRRIALVIVVCTSSMLR